MSPSHRCQRYPRGAAALLTLALTVSAAAEQAPRDATGAVTIAVADRPELVPVEVPSLEAFDPAVAHQLRSAAASAAAVVAAADADDGARAEAFGELAQLLHAYELLGSARAAYANAMRLAPENPAWRYLAGHAAEAAGDLDAAIALWQETRSMLGDAGNDPRLLGHLGRAYQARGDLPAARAHLERALAVQPDLAAARASLGEVVLAEGDATRAVALLEAALAAVPAADRLHYPLAMAYRKLGDLETARRHLAARGSVGLAIADPRLDALEALKTGERVHLLRGRQAFAAGRYAEAAEAFEIAVAADPASGRARVNLAAALAALGDSEAAIRQLRAALEQDADNGTAHFNLGQLLAASEPETSLEHLRRAASLLAADGAVHRTLAEALRARGLTEEALEHYVEATAWSPQDEAAIVGRAAMLVELGRYAEATRGLATAHAHLPWQGRIAAALARLLAASPDASVRDGASALRIAREIFAASSDARDARLVALALAELGRCQDAASLVAQARDAVAADQPLFGAFAADHDFYAAGPPCRPPIAAPAASQP